MDADEESNFAALLSQSTALPARPTWSPPSSSTNVVDPWANPFASSPTNPFSSSTSSTLPTFGGEPDNNTIGSGSGYLPLAAASNYDDTGFDVNGGFGDTSSGYNGGQSGGSIRAALEQQGEEESPYMRKLETQQIIPPQSGLPDAPSVLAARERESMGWGGENEFGGSDSIYPGVRNGVAPDTFESAGQSQSISPVRQGGWNENGHIIGNASSPIKTSPTKPVSPTVTTKPKVGGRMLPADLIDEDLMAATDPSISLKRAFVKSTPASTGTKGGAGSIGKTPEKPKQGAYVFRPAGKISPVRHTAEVVKVVPSPKTLVKVEKPSEKVIEKGKRKESETEVEEGSVNPNSTAEEIKVIKEEEKREDGIMEPASGSSNPEQANGDSSTSEQTVPGEPDAEQQPKDLKEDATAIVPEADVEALVDKSPASNNAEPHQSIPAVPAIDTGSAQPTEIKPHSIPLPASLAPTRTSTPLPAARSGSPSPPMPPVQTPTHDRVAVSPLEPPTAQVDDGFGFSSLSIGAAAVMPPPAEHDGWGGSESANMGGSAGASGSRFGGKGWGAMDAAEEDDQGLFGRGGPVGDPWGGSGAVGGWGSEQRAVAGPSSPPIFPAPFAEEEQVKQNPDAPSTPKASIIPPSKSRRKTHPVFTISISDPARVGDPVRGYTVYTIRTRTTSPHYRKSEFTALRRFSDFLWLFDSLITNNPGIIVPPVPDKHTFGRFQEQFIETRRLALERSLNKIASHPVLQLDPDLRLFLESDNFSAEIKGRRSDIPPDLPISKSSGGLLGSWNTPKFIESDDWFTSRSSFLDGLENQLKSLSKSIDIASKSRLDMATAHLEVAEAFQALADSDLGSAMCASLAKLGDLAKREKEGSEELAKGDVVNLLNMADEYVRFVGSVRRAMGGRERVWLSWQALDKEVGRLKGVREKMRIQGKLGDRAAQTLSEINEIDRRARIQQQEYETLTKLVKSEFTRFERERVEEFKRVLERYLDDQIDKQREMVMAWEEYHVGVLGMVKKAQGIRAGEGEGS